MPEIINACKAGFRFAFQIQEFNFKNKEKISSNLKPINYKKNSGLTFLNYGSKF